MKLCHQMEEMYLKCITEDLLEVNLLRIALGNLRRANDYYSNYVQPIVWIKDKHL